MERDQLITWRPLLPNQQKESEDPNPEKTRRADAGEGEPAAEPVNTVDSPVGIRPPGDVPEDQPAQPERGPGERIASGAKGAELLVDRRRPLPQKAAHPPRAREGPATPPGPGAGAPPEGDGELPHR